MKKIVMLVALGLLVASQAFAEIKWVNSSSSSEGGYFRDTSNDGVKENNASVLGYNK